jgi:hypothetical protein
VSASQFPLFPEDRDPDTAPYQPHSETSHAAAEAIEPDLATLRGKVLAHLRACGKDGATDDEMQVALDMNPSTQRPRRIELCNAGWVVPTEQTRTTRGGREACVWKAREEKP